MPAYAVGQSECVRGIGVTDRTACALSTLPAAQPMPGMSANSNTPPAAAPVPDPGPTLDACTCLRLGLQLQAIYDPVLDEVLDPRLAELLQQLESDRDQVQAGA